MYTYNENFYSYINAGAVDSANRLLPVLINAVDTPIHSVLDVGCGAGAWLSVWKSLGAQVFGLDGGYVSSDQLMIEPGEFLATDLVAGFSLDRKFDLVQSLEVAEHLPESAAQDFVANLCRHGDLVLFSAAPPGQGGENHLNEQSYEYWRGLFKTHGFTLYDPVRRALSGDARVKAWYRYNTFLYVGEQCKPEVLAALLPFLVSPGRAADELSPVSYRLRKLLVRLLPRSVSTRLAIAKKTWHRFLPG